MKYYILFGPPGAGKGTQAGAMASKYNLRHISTGELLRAEIAAGTELGKKAKSLIDDGLLVPDEVVEGMIESAFETTKGVDGFLLDGFPRTLGQAADLDAMLARKGEGVTGIVSLMIPDEIVYKRIAHRAAIEGRADDASEEVISHRIATYHEKTEPLINYYKEQGKYYEIDGYGGEGPEGIEVVRGRVNTLMDSFYDKKKIGELTFAPYLRNAEIEKIIDGVAAKIDADYAGCGDVPVFLCVLNGAIMFTAAIMKRVTFPAELVSIKLSSYQGTESTGTVLIPLGLTADVTGRRIIIFEDIVDTGNTIVALKEYLLEKGAKDVKIATMLMKPEVYSKDCVLDYVGKEIPNKFIIGYGLDYNELGRNLPDIYAVEQ